MAAVRSNQPTAGRVGVSGDRFLLVASQHPGLVYRDSNGIHADHPSLGDADRPAKVDQLRGTQLGRHRALVFRHSPLEAVDVTGSRFDVASGQRDC